MSDYFANDYYDVFISYRVRTDAKTLFSELRANHTKNTKVFLDNVELKLGYKWKKQFLAALKHSKVCVPIISNEFITKLVVSDVGVDNVLLEWDTIIECCENDSGQLIVPLFVDDATGPLDSDKADAAMKPIKAMNCARTAEEIWRWFKDNQGRKIDLRDSNQLKLFILELQELIAEQPNPIQVTTKRKPLQYNLYEEDDPEIFIDCGKVIGEIRAILEKGNICNLKGIGGSGKTFVANKCAFVMLADGYIIAKFTADNEENLLKDFEEYLLRLLKRDKLPISCKRVRDYLRLLNDSDLPKQFIILDNVKSIKDVEDFKHSKNPNVKFLITSRTFITKPVIYKEFYSEEACIEYLKRETDRGFTIADCKSIFDVTNGFPLRLAIAARTLCDPAESLADYLADVNRKKSAMNFNFNPDHDSSDDVDELFPEVSLSVDKLQQKERCGHLFLALLAYLEPDLIIEKYLIESVEKYRGEATGTEEILVLNSGSIQTSRKGAVKLGILENANSQSTLENESSSSLAIKIHRCVQAEIRDRVQMRASLEAVARKIAKLYDEITKSCDTLVSVLREGKVDDVSVLLQKWPKCSLD
ncbi:hypothetical protein HK098_006412, partial [Nowakowskiella sp. JEL0407]